MKNNEPIPKAPTVSKELAMRNIAEWLYVNDKEIDNNKEWREGLLQVIHWNIKRIK